MLEVEGLSFNYEAYPVYSSGLVLQLGDSESRMLRRQYGAMRLIEVFASFSIAMTSLSHHASFITDIKI
jgi:hypothetical protein